MLVKKPQPASYSKWIGKTLKTVFILEALGIAVSYGVYFKLNTERDFRLYMHKNCNWVLEGYYQLGSGLLTTRPESLTTKCGVTRARSSGEMDIAIRASFWVVTFGGLGYALFKLAKPNEELLKKYDQESKHTDTRRLANQTVSILKDATKQDSELNKKIEELLKK